MTEQQKVELNSLEVESRLAFHYTSADTAEKILSSGELWLAPFTSTNDPRENAQWHVDFTWPVDGGRPPERLLNLSGEVCARVDETLDRHFRQGAVLSCFCLDRQPYEDSAAGTFFHRGWARARMWEQYGEKHHGACLVFDHHEFLELVDTHRPVEEGSFFSHLEVRYIDAPLKIPVPLEAAIADDLIGKLNELQVRDGIAEHVYFTKNRDWESESEYRIVCVRWDPPSEELGMPVPISFGRSLKAIVLGQDFEMAASTGLSRFLDQHPDVGLWQCVWQNGHPWLVNCSR